MSSFLLRTLASCAAARAGRETTRAAVRRRRFFTGASGSLLVDLVLLRSVLHVPLLERRRGERVLVAVVDLQGQDVDRRSVDRSPHETPSVGCRPTALGARLRLVLHRQQHVAQGAVPLLPVLAVLLGTRRAVELVQRERAVVPVVVVDRELVLRDGGQVAGEQ